MRYADLMLVRKEEEVQFTSVLINGLEPLEEYVATLVTDRD